ncbi:MAG TPA: 30S ribosomal protein S6 [Sumerlaeia bacterium]|nr:30S ribosomal protein S6 [Sumerlaeia bacterium]
MAQNYEFVLLLDPDLPQSSVQEYQDQFSKIITDHDGEVVHIQTWGKKRLEYEIVRKKEAIFVIFYFRMQTVSAKPIEEFERQVRINDDLLRGMTVKVPVLKILNLPAADSGRGGGAASAPKGESQAETPRAETDETASPAAADEASSGQEPEAVAPAETEAEGNGE